MLYTLVDYVAELDWLKQGALQVHKCFSMCKLLDKGFANKQVLVLVETPMTLILMNGFVTKKKKEQCKEQQEPPSLMYTAFFSVVGILVVKSLVGGIHAMPRLDPSQKLYGNINLEVATMLFYPTVVLLYSSVAIINGLVPWPNPWSHYKLRLKIMANFQDDALSIAHTDSGDKPKSAKLQAVTIMPSMDTRRLLNNKNKFEPQSPYYPNAGCGFGNFDLHLPTGSSIVDEGDKPQAFQHEFGHGTINAIEI
jgi:hypothetical protein